jgi:cytochrome b6-f complex iron-sulfur subunit
MKRRRLLAGMSWTVIGSALSIVWGFLSGCKPRSGQDKEGFVRFVALPVLDEAGFILQDYFAKDPVIVIRDPQDKNVIHAVNALCTHQQCLVNWQKEKNVFICPCHGSTFGPDGKFLQGPANKALATFPAKILGDDVWVKAE